jgi:hypothetical protein
VLARELPKGERGTKPYFRLGIVESFAKTPHGAWMGSNPE